MTDLTTSIGQPAGPVLVAIIAICTSDGGPNGQYLYLPFDVRFFWFPAMAAILSALLIGLGPGLRAAQMAPYLAMKSGPASLGTRRDSSRSLLIVAQVALSMTVLVGAGLLVRTIQKLLAQDLGYDPEGVLTVEASLAVGDDSPERQAFIARELLLCPRTTEHAVFENSRKTLERRHT